MWPQEFNRVIFVDPRLPHMGGRSTYMETISEALSTAGVAVTHVSLWPGTSPAKFPTVVVFRRERLHAGPLLRGNGNPMKRLWALPFVAFKRMDRLWALRRFRRFISGLGSDTIVVFTDVKSRMVLKESGFTRKESGPVFIGQHHTSFDALKYETWLCEALPENFADMDAITALTPQDAAQLEQLTGVPCYHLRNPLPGGIIPGTSHGPIAVALVRFTWEKQIDVMIRSFVAATASPDLGHWKLLIYGEGDLYEQMETYIRELGVGGRVMLMGRTDDAAAALRPASLNLLTSRFEGFGLTILEAAAAGVPSVVFDCSPGVRSLVRPDTGYLVPENDEEAYAEALREAMRDNSERNRRGVLASRMSAEYAPERVVDDFGKIAVAAAGDHPRSRRTEQP